MQGFKNTTFGFLLVLSLIAILAGFGGISCAFKPCAEGSCRKFGPRIYGCSLMFIWLVYVIVGGILTGTANTAPEMLEEFCKGNVDEQLAFASDAIAEIDSAINGYSS